MTEPDAHPIGPADGEALSAWLAGELAPAEAEVLEARLATEPALVRRLMVLHDALVELRDLDAAEPPEGFDAALTERVGSDLGGEVVALDRSARGTRPTPGTRSAPWGRLAAVAAAMVLLGGVLSVPLMFGGSSGDDASSVAPLAGPGEGATDAASEMETGAGDAEAAAARPTAPVIVEQGLAAVVGPPVSDSPVPEPQSSAEEDTAGGGQAAEVLGDRFLTVPEAVGLLGVGVEEARAIAQDFSAVVRGAPPFTSGVRPDACLSVVTEPAPEKPLTVLVPARVEAFVYEESPAIAYVLVGASTDAPALDRVELWVTDPVTCDTRIFLSR